MKKLFIYAAIVAAAMGGMTSCSDFLNVEPAGKVSEPDTIRRYPAYDGYVCHIT